MALVDVTKSCLDSLRQISEHIEGAVVYLDAGSTESFQYTGSYPVFLDLGARGVCSLENISSIDVVDCSSSSGTTSKIVVFTSRLLSDAHRYILLCLSTHQPVRHCIVFTSISEVAHLAYPDSPLGPDAYGEYESLLIQDYEELVKKSGTKSTQSVNSNTLSNASVEEEGWSRLSTSGEDVPENEVSSSGRDIYGHNRVDCLEDVEQKLVVYVHHFPMILCPISPRVFVLPSDGSLAEACLSREHEDSFGPGLPPLSTGMLSDTDDVPPGATLTAHFLYHLAAKMDLKMEIFSLGDLSKTVGKIMTDMSSLYDVGRRKRSAGLLLIDRTLDLLTPCCHGDSLVDRIFTSIPRRDRTTSYTQVKDSRTNKRYSPSSWQRASLDLQIPLQKLLTEEDCELNNLRLLDSVEAFLCGWNSSSSDSKIVDLMNLEKQLHDSPVPSQNQVLNGSLVSTESFRGTPFLEALLDRRTKDGTVLVKKWLQETLRGEKIAVNVKSRPGLATKGELQSMVKALARNQSSLLKNKGIIQLAAATVSALEEPNFSKWEAFVSAERMLSVSSGDTSQSLAAQIDDLINKSALVGAHAKEGKGQAQRVLSLQDALLLLIVGYILAGENFPTSGSDGPFSWQEERMLKESLVDAILENPSIATLEFLHGLREELEANLNKKQSQELGTDSSKQLEFDDFDDEGWGNWGDEDADDSTKKEHVYGDMQLKLELRDRVDNLFKFLHKIAGSQRSNIPLRDGSVTMEGNSSGDSYTGKGLLYKLLIKALGKFDIPGLEYHSTTVGRLFKSGFGRFGLGQAKPTLADQNVILVFVIGGINGIEVREAQEALSESGRPDIELILGGTTLLTPNDMLYSLLGKC